MAGLVLYEGEAGVDLKIIFLQKMWDATIENCVFSTFVLS